MRTKIRLINSDVHSIDLSIAEARKVFSEITAARAAHETRAFEVGSLEWTIDARSDGEIIITIKDGLSSMSHSVGWYDIERATTEFSSWLDRLSQQIESEVTGVDMRREVSRTLAGRQ